MTWTIVMPQRQHGASSMYSRYYDQPVIVINSRFEMLLTPAAHEMLGKAGQVEVLHDPSMHSFGLRVAGKNDPSFAIQGGTTAGKNGERVPVTKGMVRISTKACRDYHWGKEDHTTFYRAQMDANGILMADYHRPIETIYTPIKRRNRKNGSKP